MRSTKSGSAPYGTSNKFFSLKNKYKLSISNYLIKKVKQWNSTFIQVKENISLSGIIIYLSLIRSSSLKLLIISFHICANFAASFSLLDAL